MQRLACKVFMFIDRIALLSESATYNSIFELEIMPRLKPDGCAHSQSFKSNLWLKLPSLPDPLKLNPLLVFRFNAQI
jgi:hypothetical protein